MTRKWLSGVLAFAMVFGCTAPVAMAEETPVETVEDVDVVEQYATYHPQFKIGLGSYFTLENTDGKTVKLEIANGVPKKIAEPKTLKVEYKKEDGGWATLTKGELTLSDDGDYVTLKRTATQEDKTLEVRVTLEYAQKLETMSDGTVVEVVPETSTTVDGKIVPAAAAGYTYTINGEEDPSEGKGFDNKAKADHTKAKADTSMTFTFAAKKNADDTPVLPVVTAKSLTDTKDYVSVVEVTDDDAVTYKVTFKKSNYLSEDDNTDEDKGNFAYEPNVAVRFTVKWPGATSSVNYDYYFDVDKADADVYGLKLTASRTTMEKADHIDLAAKATQQDGFGDEIDYDQAPLTWYINGTEVVFENDKAVLTDIIKDTVVTLTRKENHAITFSADRTGTFTITTTDKKNNLSSSVTINVVDTLKMDNFYIGYDGDTATKGVKTKAVEAKFGGETDFSTERYAVALGSVSSTYIEKLVKDTDIKLSYALSDDGIVVKEMDGENVVREERYCKANGKLDVAKAVVGVGADGKVTVAGADNETMKALLAKHGSNAKLSFDVIVTATQGDKKLDVTLEVTTRKPTGKPTNMTVFADGKALSFDKNGYAVISMKTGDKVDFDAIVTDGYFADGIDQTISWSVKNSELYDHTLYAAIDEATGVLTAYKATNRLAQVEIASKANPLLQYHVKLVIEGADYEDPKPTETPTQKPETLTGKVVTKSSALNIRAAATTSSAIVAKAAKGSTVTILGEEGDFYKVQLANGTIGYASKAYIAVSTTPTTPDVPTPVTGTATTTANLRLRKSASTSSSKITTMPKGSTVTVLEKGSEWSKVEYNGKTGYASNAYLTFNTIG